MNSCLDAVKNMPLLNRKSPIVVAVSGGLDSMVLLDVLLHLDRNIVIAHVNHKMRQESDQEYAYLKSYAVKHNIPFEGHVLEEKITDNFQATARKKRRAFFISVANKYKTNIIVLAHHLDDQLETILMRFVNGYDLHTLRGIDKIDEANNYYFVHPFLDIKKEVLSAYAQKHVITYFTDESNKDIAYTRNRFRHTIIPLLLDENPNIHQTMHSYHESFGAYESLINDLANQFLKTQNDSLNYEAFSTLNPLVQKHILKTLIANHTNEHYQISTAMIERLLTMLKESKTNFTYPLSKTTDFHKSYNRIFIANSMKKIPFYLTITEEGLYQTDTDKKYFVTHDNLTHLYSNYAVLWYNDKVFPLYIRNRRNGDKIHKSYGTKKIKDLLIDKKVPPHLRNTILFIANDKEVLWIPSLKIKKDYDNPLTNKLYVYEV